MKDGKFQKLGIDTSYRSIVFFDDGLFIGDVGVQGLTVPEHINKAGIEGGHISGQHSGTYEISHDTIKVKYINWGRQNNTWGGWETWYKIMDKNIIADFYHGYLALSRSDRRIYKARTYVNAIPSKFVHVPNMPKSYNWLIDEEWFKCSEQ